LDALNVKSFQNVNFMPNWICRAPEVASARLTSEVDCERNKRTTGIAGGSAWSGYLESN